MSLCCPISQAPCEVSAIWVGTQKIHVWQMNWSHSTLTPESNIKSRRFKSLSQDQQKLYFSLHHLLTVQAIMALLLTLEIYFIYFKFQERKLMILDTDTLKHTEYFLIKALSQVLFSKSKMILYCLKPICRSLLIKIIHKWYIPYIHYIPNYTFPWIVLYFNYDQEYIWCNW